MNAEQAVIGALLQGGDPALVDLSPADFERKDHALIYDVIEQLTAEHKPVDIVTVCDRLESRYPRQGFPDYAIGLVEQVPGHANLKQYADQVRQKACQRRVLQIAADLQANIERPDAVDTAIRDLMAINTGARNYEYSAQDLMASAFEAVSQQDDVGITTGLHELDDKIGGFRRGDLYVVAARPAIGKTAFMLNMAMRCGVPSGMISTEQGHEQIGVRLIAMAGRISAHRLRLNQLSESDWDRVPEISAKLGERDLWTNDQPGPTLADLQRQARKWKHHHAIEILYVDYIQRIKGDKSLPRHEQVAETTMGLKELARELNIPVVALAQVNREVERRENKRPHMADLKDSGAIEQEADNIMTLYRDEVYNPETTDKGIAEISVLKNRHGPIGYVRCVWLAEYMLFENLAEGKYFVPRSRSD